MAAVYLANHTPTQQIVALKILSAQLSHIESFRQRFELEAKITAGLRHPNIVPVVAYGAVEESLFIAMHYMRGGTLHDKFVLDGSVVLQNTARYLHDIAAGLDYAHSMGIIHRDLKLANVLLNEDSHALLSDFGIARIIESSLHLTDSGSVLGSPHYMSPEQNEGKPLDARSDLYSLAVMAFLMVTGQFPFHAETPVAIALQHVTKEPPRPSAFNAILPTSLDTVILKGLAKKPGERFHSAQEFAAAFERAIGDCDVKTVVNLPMLSRSRTTPAHGPVSPTPPTLPPQPLPVAIPFPSAAAHRVLDEQTSPSAPFKRTVRRYGSLLFLAGIGVVLFFTLRLALDQFRPVGVLNNTLTATPTLSMTPIQILPPPSLAANVTPTRSTTPKPGAPVTATPPNITIVPSLTVAPIRVFTLQSPFTVIIKGVERPSNIRSAPDIGAPVLAQIFVDDTPTVIARTASTNIDQVWYLVLTKNGVKGWVRGDVVELLPIGAQVTQVPLALTIPASSTSAITLVGGTPAR